MGSFRKPLVLLGHPQKKVLMRGVSLLGERAHLFGACAPIGGIVQMRMISHSMQYEWTRSTIPFARIRMAAAQDRSYQDFKRRKTRRAINSATFWVSNINILRACAYHYHRFLNCFHCRVATEHYMAL